MDKTEPSGNSSGDTAELDRQKAGIFTVECDSFMSQTLIAIGDLLNL